MMRTTYMESFPTLADIAETHDTDLHGAYHIADKCMSYLQKQPYLKADNDFEALACLYANNVLPRLKEGLYE